MSLDLAIKMHQSSQILLLLLLFVAQLRFSLLLQHLCGQCRQELCPVIRDCGKGRMRELDECGCCTRCTKSIGEPCGGLEQRSCSPGQYCAYRPGRTFGYFREGFCEPSKAIKILYTELLLVVSCVYCMSCNYIYWCTHLTRS